MKAINTIRLITRIGATQLFKKHQPHMNKLAILGTIMLGYNYFNMTTFMHQFQSTVVSDVHPHCAVVVLDVDSNNKEQLKLVLDALKSASQPSDVDLEELPPLLVGVGFQTKFWELLTKQPQEEYEVRVGKHGKMPYGRGNIIIHIKANTQSLAVEAVQSLLHSLPKSSFQVVSERYGYKYKDGRDLSGFLDGTMNPNISQQRAAVATNEKGGSYLIHQIWQHKLDYLESLPVSEQENMIGRAKSNSIEMRQLPATSHVARTRNEQKQRLLIVRQSMPYGTVSGEHGLLFLAYAKNLSNFNQMLDRMVGKDDGINDEIMKMSNNTFGNYYYVPSQKELRDL